VRRKKALWSKSGRAQLESFVLSPWASRRRQDLLDVLDRLNPTIDELSTAVEQEAKKRPEVLRLMTHPGVGSLTALAFVLILGSAERFACGKQIGSYLGLIPCEDSSANRQRLAQALDRLSSVRRSRADRIPSLAVNPDPMPRSRGQYGGSGSRDRPRRVGVAHAHTPANQCCYWRNRPSFNLCNCCWLTFAGKLDFGCVGATSATDKPMLACTGVARKAWMLPASGPLSTIAMPEICPRSLILLAMVA
jgi:hypothetical protein